MKDWKLLQQTRESTLCNNWLTAEMNSAERHTECLICDAWLDEESLDRCLKCHAAKWQHCDVDHTFCIKCDFMKPDWAQMFFLWKNQRGITGAAQIQLKIPRIAESMKDWKLLQRTREKKQQANKRNMYCKSMWVMFVRYKERVELVGCVKALSPFHSLWFWLKLNG